MVQDAIFHAEGDAMDNVIKLPWMMIKRRSWSISISRPEAAEDERPTTAELSPGPQRR